MTGYWQMRRHARQARRAGMQPMMVINSGNQLPEPLGIIIVSALGRLAFRHRSVFAPLWIALAAFIAAGAIHGHHARWWVPVTVITAAATVVLAFPLPVLRRHPAGRRIAGFFSRLWEKCGIVAQPHLGF